MKNKFPTVLPENSVSPNFNKRAFMCRFELPNEVIDNFTDNLVSSFANKALFDATAMTRSGPKPMPLILVDYLRKEILHHNSDKNDKERFIYACLIIDTIVMEIVKEQEEYV